jgi:hypothetical protein
MPGPPSAVDVQMAKLSDFWEREISSQCLQMSDSKRCLAVLRQFIELRSSHLSGIIISAT